MVELNYDYLCALAEDMAHHCGVYISYAAELHNMVVRNGRPVGAIWTIIDYGHGCLTFDVVVDPAYRRQGIATRLVQSAIELAEEMHLDYIEAMVVSDDMRRILRKLGFEEEVIGPGRYLMRLECRF